MTADLEFEVPIGIRMQIVSTDDHVGSMCMNTRVLIKYPTGDCSYAATNIRFRYVDWDRFVADLEMRGFASGKSEAILRDVSHAFIIRIRAEFDEGHFEKLYFEWQCEEPDTGIGAIRMKFERTIDYAMLDAIRQAFSSFPKWW